MAVTVQMQFASAVTEIYEDACIGSSIANGMTTIQFDLCKLDFQRVLFAEVVFNNFRSRVQQACLERHLQAVYLAVTG